MRSKAVTFHDPVFLGIVSVMLVGGLFLLSSASVDVSQKLYGSVSYIALRQAFAILIGLAVFFAAQAVPYQFWRRIAPAIALVSLILLVLVLIPSIGVELHGARRWISLGLFTFQPSELAKLGLIFGLGWWFERIGGRVHTFTYGIIPFLATMGVVGGLMAAEPDLGTLGIMIAVALALYFAAGARLREIGFLIALGLIALFVLAYLAPYRFDRLKVFFQRDIDPQGIGYQVRQASIAIGSGGFWGLGYGASQQKSSNLPEPVGDSIFAVVAEEFGFLGAATTVILFLSLLWRGALIARRAPSIFAKLLVIGVVTSLVSQAFINIGSISGLLPLTGVPLPFISYGGTSIVITLAGLGVVYRIAKKP